MARAMVTFERQADGGWKPTIVWLVTRHGIEAKDLPGDANRRNYKMTVLKDAQRPRRDPDSVERGTWEDWVDWALNALGNGYTSWAIEVEPEPTVRALYEREILDVTPTPNRTPPGPSSRVPEGNQRPRMSPPSLPGPGQFDHRQVSGVPGTRGTTRSSNHRRSASRRSKIRARRGAQPLAPRSTPPAP